METPTLALTQDTATRGPNNVVGQKNSRRKRKYKTHIHDLATRERSKSDTACPTAVAELLMALQGCGNYVETLPVPRMGCIEETVVAMPRLWEQKRPAASTEAAAPKAPTRSRCVRKHMRKRANKRARKEAAHVLVGLAANAENVAVQLERPGIDKDLGPVLASSTDSYTEPVTRQEPVPTTSSIPVSVRDQSAWGTVRSHHMHVPRHPLVPCTVLINN
ncbi:hypothetical protein BGX38DRAFT_1330930 [Terfezia claveryi]|nr:hypothetical protein BGX38DRAFT_1330930 [Terfezia claveryi]